MNEMPKQNLDEIEGIVNNQNIERELFDDELNIIKSEVEFRVLKYAENNPVDGALLDKLIDGFLDERIKYTYWAINHPEEAVHAKGVLKNIDKYVVEHQIGQGKNINIKKEVLKNKTDENDSALKTWAKTGKVVKTAFLAGTLGATFIAKGSAEEKKVPDQTILQQDYDSTKNEKLEVNADVEKIKAELKAELEPIIKAKAEKAKAEAEKLKAREATKAEKTKAKAEAKAAKEAEEKAKEAAILSNLDISKVTKDGKLEKKAKDESVMQKSFVDSNESNVDIEKAKAELRAEMEPKFRAIAAKIKAAQEAEVRKIEAQDREIYERIKTGVNVMFIDNPSSEFIHTYQYQERWPGDPHPRIIKIKGGIIPPFTIGMINFGELTDSAIIVKKHNFSGIKTHPHLLKYKGGGLQSAFFDGEHGGVFRQFPGIPRIENIIRQNPSLGLVLSLKMGVKEQVGGENMKSPPNLNENSRQGEEAAPEKEVVAQEKVPVIPSEELSTDAVPPTKETKQELGKTAKFDDTIIKTELPDGGDVFSFNDKQSVTIWHSDALGKPILKVEPNYPGRPEDSVAIENLLKDDYYEILKKENKNQDLKLTVNEVKKIAKDIFYLNIVVGKFKDGAVEHILLDQYIKIQKEMVVKNFGNVWK